MCGALHLHVPITFEDQVEWLVTFRKNFQTYVDESMAFKLTASEVAAAQALHKVAPSFIPHVRVPEGQDGEC
jgi:hypothetical protein